MRHGARMVFKSKPGTDVGPLWPYIKAVTVSIFVEADTATIRILLANASCLWAMGVLWKPIIFEHPAFKIMHEFGSVYMWACLFLAHWMGVYWRLYDPFSRPAWGLIVNGLGFVIWSVSTISINVALARFSPTTALEVTLCFASAWALYRTGFKSERVTP